MPGTVVTFYSYKGGVGRSFALANIAVVLARWGYRVLCADWDLEAPGLHEYFRPLLAGPPTSGVVDLVNDFHDGRLRVADHAVRLTGVGALDFIAAGRENASYPGLIQQIDWENLYAEKFGDYLERCREQWTEAYDFILIDSRTGVSDIGAICAAHLSDRLVVLCTANKQSIEGAVDMANRANAARDKMPYDRPQLTVLPVLSRFDTRVEYDRSEEWRRLCVEKTKHLLSNWLSRGVPPEALFRHLTLPYVSYWSFGEQLPVRAESSPSADQISFALETVAAVIAHDFDRTDLLVENRDTYVDTVRAPHREFSYDLQVSTPRSTSDFATELIKNLDRRGVHSQRSLSADRSLLARTVDNARHLCLIVDGQLSRWQEAEAELFLRRTVGKDRRMIPVLSADAKPNALPGYFGNLRYLRFGPDRGPAEVAGDVADQLHGRATPADVDSVDLVAVLRKAPGARLRPVLWHLVDELVRELRAAVRAGDETRAREVGADIALALRPRVTGTEDSVKVPVSTLATINQVVRMLEDNTMRRELG